MGDKTKRITALEEAVSTLQMQVVGLRAHAQRTECTTTTHTSGDKSVEVKKERTVGMNPIMTEPYAKGPGIPDNARRQAFVKRHHGHAYYYAYEDGDTWFAVLPDFINIQESISGYGNSVWQARTNLVIQMDKYLQVSAAGNPNIPEGSEEHVVAVGPYKGHKAFTFYHCGIHYAVLDTFPGFEVDGAVYASGDFADEALQGLIYYIQFDETSEPESRFNPGAEDFVTQCEVAKERIREDLSEHHDGSIYAEFLIEKTIEAMIQHKYRVI